MMDGMRRPKPPNAVAAAMEPVVAEILADNEYGGCKDKCQRQKTDRINKAEGGGGAAAGQE
jgi:hypothetical protein